METRRFLRDPCRVRVQPSGLSTTKALPRNVLIFRSTLLPYTEPYIPGQAEKFQRFTPYYAGFAHETGAEFPLQRTIPCSHSKFVGKLRNLAAILGFSDRFFRNSVLQVQPELIHAHFEDSAIKVLPLAQALNLPLFLTCHGSDHTEGHRWQNVAYLGNYYRRRRTAFLKELTLCLGASRFICDRMLGLGYPPEKVRLHYIGVDTERLQPDPAVQKKPEVLFVGRLVKSKGCADLIRAMVRVRTKFPEVKLVIIGEGQSQADLHQLAAEERIDVEFLGRQTPDNIRRRMLESMLLCLPSVVGSDGSAETLGLVTLEAQAVGLPVVGTWTGGIPEAVEHGVTGLLSEGRNPAALAENIIAILSDSDLRAQMGQAARKRMVRQFNLQRQSELLEDYYLEFV